jgi:hypothetical protein
LFGGRFLMTQKKVKVLQQEFQAQVLRGQTADKKN